MEVEETNACFGNRVGDKSFFGFNVFNSFSPYKSNTLTASHPSRSSHSHINWTDNSTMSVPPLPPSKGLLGRHRVLAPTAAVHVSPICLGAMNFGNAMKDYFGTCSKETAFEILDYFYEQGGNFIDTLLTLSTSLKDNEPCLQSVIAQIATRLKSQRPGWANG